MALSAYCKKCGRETVPGGVCPVCGGKLGPAHAFWRVNQVPVRSWVSWNAPMRLILPCAGIIFLALLLAEAASGGADAMNAFLSGGIPTVLLCILIGIMTVTGLILFLQGRHTCEISADKSGITMRVLLSNPDALRLLAHFRSPKLMEDSRLRMEYGLLLEERRMSWKDVSRVQLWPEQGTVLLYAPRWWLRMAVPCDSEGWQEMSALITEKLGKDRHAHIPAALRPKEKAGQRKKPAASSRRTGGTGSGTGLDDGQLLAEIRAMNAEIEREESRQEN
ncbi:MAG: hypothetical protein IJK28_10920 [Clostridia bacterium]|nr:hypothetical protein [Clostridia bacterium]